MDCLIPERVLGLCLNTGRGLKPPSTATEVSIPIRAWKRALVCPLCPLGFNDTRFKMVF